MLTVQEKSFGVVIAAADIAAALPGVVSAYTSLAVLGVLPEDSLPVT
ncbi:AIR carboxylase family protein [uncultured Chitinophaga sp.]